MKLWQKEKTTISEKIEKFTVGDDAKWDVQLAAFDIQGSLAHITMLESIHLLEKEELSTLRKLGVDNVQGYFIGRPAPINEAIEYQAVTL